MTFANFSFSSLFFLSAVAVCFFVGIPQAQAQTPTTTGAFVITVDTTATGTSATNQFTIPTTGGGYNFDVLFQSLSSTTTMELGEYWTLSSLAYQEEVHLKTRCDADVSGRLRESPDIENLSTILLLETLHGSEVIRAINGVSYQILALKRVKEVGELLDFKCIIHLWLNE
jgi:hypothetical protein